MYDNVTAYLSCLVLSARLFILNNLRTKGWGVSKKSFYNVLFGHCKIISVGIKCCCHAERLGFGLFDRYKFNIVEMLFIGRD